MSDLNDFFAQNSKKTKKQPKAAAKRNPAAAKETQAEPATAAAVQQPVADAAQNDFAENSSDDESNTVVIAEGRSKIIDKKDLEAKKTKEDSDPTGGWGLGSKMGQAPETGPSTTGASRPAGNKGMGGMGGMGGMVFGGKPTFTRKTKGIMDGDFPDISLAEAAANKSTTNAPQSKANGAMQWGGSTANGPRTENGTDGGEERKQATKPVFRGKAKLNLGGASNEEVGRMNYDFSKMNMSSANAARKEGEEGEEGKPRAERPAREMGRPGNRQMPVFEEADDDFEVVKEKEKKAPRERFEEPTFGGGKPMFSRGGAPPRQDE